jgi:hypothetical protein
MKQAILITGLFVFISASSSAEIIVPEGFVVDKIIDRIDGQTPYLEAVRDPNYGHGVIAASFDKTTGILKVIRIYQDAFDLLGLLSDFPVAEYGGVSSIEFDKSGVFDNSLFVSVSYDVDGYKATTDILGVYSSGEVFRIGSYGGQGNELGLKFSISRGTFGYQPGFYLIDGDNGNGECTYLLNTEFELLQLVCNYPPGIGGFVPGGMEFDSTGNYGNYLTYADSGYPSQISGIFQLLPDLSWNVIASANSSVRSYRDICICSNGSFGQTLYATDRATNTVVTVDPNGVHETFASGFDEIESITADDPGEYMYVSDSNGVWRIRADTTIPGPLLVMREPWVEDDDVHTGEAGVDDLRLLWSEPIQFSNVDITVENEDSNSIPFSVSGSGSQFMIIAFGEKLLNDKYTLTIKDTVKSVDEEISIDGDKDGNAGGDAILVMEHRERHDSDNDNNIDFYDLARFANKWLWME